jgi:hypothetical protein
MDNKSGEAFSTELGCNEFAFHDDPRPVESLPIMDSTALYWVDTRNHLIPNYFRRELETT